MALLRRHPSKSAPAFHLTPMGGKRLHEAQASISLPSTPTRSSEIGTDPRPVPSPNRRSRDAHQPSSKQRVHTGNPRLRAQVSGQGGLRNSYASHWGAFMRRNSTNHFPHAHLCSAQMYQPPVRPSPVITKPASAASLIVRLQASVGRTPQLPQK